jgi:hypothetical protein
VVRHSDAAAATSPKTSVKGRREVIRVGSVTLFGPVGQKELDFIDARCWSACPPARLPPICYPVLKGNCTSAFARDGNPKDVANGSVGYVTEWAPARRDWND